MTRTVRSLAALAVVLLSTVAGTAAASARVPFGFVGVMADGPIAEPGFDPAAETPTMVASGVESIRAVIHWVDAQPERDRPPTFDRSDPLVRAAALRGIRVLPVLTTAPGWAAKHRDDFASPPAGTAEYARFARAAVERYGPRGSFWAENPTVPRRPIRAWQVWNEPNLRTSWTDRRWTAPYVALLRAARASIRSADPRARIVLAGLANYSWRSLAAIYRVPGARRLFDAVAIHPYTREVSGIGTILRRARRAMDRHGDRRKRLLVTEFGWPSAKGKAKGFGIETTERGQARRAAAALSLLARERRRLGLAAIYWHDWINTDRGPGSIWAYSGLRRTETDGSVSSKPALRSFRRAALRLEDCRRKGSLATRCVSRR
jgi:hypothetical protein